MDTISVPVNSARGRLRCGLRISPTMYAAAFQPEYEYITNTRLMANGALMTCGRSVLEGANEIELTLPNTKTAIRNPMISVNMRTVQTFWNALPSRMPRKCTSATSQETARPSTSGGIPGTMALKYSPNAMAASAIGAANPTVAETQPARNPNAG